MFWRKTSGIRRLHASSTNGALPRRFGEEDAGVGEDRQRIALDSREAADKRLAVCRLELVEAAAVDDARDELARVDLLAERLGHEPVEVGRVESGRLGGCDLPGWLGSPSAYGPHDLAAEGERVLVRDRVVVGDARLPRVDVGAAELLRRHLLARRRLHERRAADEDRACALDDDRLVAHRRDIRPAGRARAHHGCDLGYAGRGETGLVVEDPAEVLAVGEDLGLKRQERPSRVDEVDARQPVLLGHLLRAEVLLDGEREIRSTFDRSVVGDDHALAALDDADARHDPGGRRLAVVQVPGGESRELEEGRVGVAEPIDALAGSELAARAMPLERLLTAALGHESRALAQLGHELVHPLPPAGEDVRVAFDRRGEHAHRHAA